MTRSNKILIFALAAAVVVAGIALWLAGVRTPGPSSQAGRAGFERGGALVASVRSEPRTFNRYVARDATSSLVSELTQAKLVRINPVTEEVEPWLAESWTGLADESYQLHLRQGVTFSDGVPFTSADVVFSFQAVYDERVASPLADSLRIQGQPLEVSAPDPATVALRFPAPFGPGLRVLDNLPILPKHRLEEAARSGLLQDAWGLTTPLDEMAGLGPFVLQQYVPGQRLVFSRNPRYWRRDGAGVPLPYLDRLTLEIVADQNAEILRLDSGQIDFTTTPVRAEDYPMLRRAAAAGRLQLFDLGVGIDGDFLWFNLKPEAKAGDPRQAWLQSTDLRRAISHAVDRETFANTVLLGLGEPVYGPITPGNRKWFAPDAPKYEYDPARARMLLGRLGLTDRDGDGALEDGRGAAVRFSLLTQRGNTSRERSAAVLQEDLHRIGIAVDVVALEFGALVDRITRADYDAVYFGFRTSDTDPAVNLDFWLSSAAFHFWNPSQPEPATEWERRIDELMQRQIATVDQDARKELFDEVQRIFGEHLPTIYFAAPRVFIATSARVANAEPALLQPHLLWNADMLAVTGSNE